MKRTIAIAVLVCLTLAPDADARWGRRRGGGMRGLLADARHTMAMANDTMASAERTMKTAQVMIRDPLFKESMAASERVLKLQVELERLKAASVKTEQEN